MIQMLAVKELFFEGAARLGISVSGSLAFQRLHVGFCQIGNVTNREFIGMLGVVLSTSREFRVYPVALDWNPGQGVGQAINLDNHPVSILNYVILDRCQIVPNLPLNHS